MTEEEMIECAAEGYRSFVAKFEMWSYLHNKCNALEHYGWAESIEQRAQEEVLSVDCLAIYPPEEEMEYQVLLSWGGPASRLRVRTDFYGEPLDVWFEYQDWFTPWIEAPNMDRASLCDYVSQFFWFYSIQEIATQFPR